jgi:hypothetical protein
MIKLRGAEIDHLAPRATAPPEGKDRRALAGVII